MTRKTLLFRCPPGGQFHFGRIALDDKTSLDATTPMYHSDTLSSAIVATAFRVFPQQAETVLDWFKTGQVRFSSFFHCLETEEVRKEEKEGGAILSSTFRHLFFLPKPAHLDTGNFTEPKKIRKVLFISKGVWEAGILPDKWLQKGYRIIDGKFLVLEEELAQLGCPGLPAGYKLFEESTVPKVFIHKLEREDNLYFHANIFLPPNVSFAKKDDAIKGFHLRVHFYAMAEHGEAVDWQIIQSLLEIIADEGIGGERSVGCGRLLGVEALDSFGISVQEESSLACTLNLVSPADEVDLGKLKAWKTLTRGGRFYKSQENFKRLKMVAEGALTEAGLQGRHWDISNSGGQASLRFGHALTLPVSKNYADYGSF
ncbi:MAG: hypothetical protein R2830_15415 [Saprospiraceae bacterium]